jgi:hypothetical protein
VEVSNNKQYGALRQESSVLLSLSKFLFDELSKHFQNFHKSSENAVIENERHP